MRFGFILLSVSILAACSSVPQNIKSAPTNDVQLNQVIANKSITEGNLVRWGGEIVSVENANDMTFIEVVQFPLNHYGKPDTYEDSQGRFVARTSDFYDPVVYKEGRLITFTGVVAGETANRKVDNRSLLMPIIDVNESYRWQRTDRSSRAYYTDPFYSPYDSFYYNHWYGNPWHGPRFGYRFYYH
ncbi:Slp family lipoprotein [Methylophaga sp. OBS3]|uniref:Slp family lipoprotein n=1 Tax=Methylophaga sp. OBS3 TaxID=2991934 RepID=UPI0022559D08|nr:Slp family lipoprotein [Methylophaga sp. OBS3]MCX4189512.1 Slp family lipoprotein [Methylophaga sp. OBS3]